MIRLTILLCLISLLPAFLVAQQQSVLVFSKTAGFRHGNIPTGVDTLKSLLKSVGLDVKHTEDANFFNNDTLSTFDAVVFLSTTGDIFDENQKKAFKKFIQNGGGYIGIHAASDTEHNWPWYGELVGGYFASHPAVQDAKLKIKNKKHLATKHLPSIWIHRDEWYDFRNIKPGLNILMELDEVSYEGGKMGKFHPISWFQEYDGGKSFYTGLGHTHESFASDNFKKHLLGGILYVLGQH